MMMETESQYEMYFIETITHLSLSSVVVHIDGGQTAVGRYVDPRINFLICTT